VTDLAQRFTTGDINVTADEGQDFAESVGRFRDTVNEQMPLPLRLLTAARSRSANRSARTRSALV